MKRKKEYAVEKKSKSFLSEHGFLCRACACLLVLILFCGVFAVMGWGALLHRVGATVIYPFQWVFTKMSDGVEGISLYFTDMDELIEENQALKEENQALKDKISQADVIFDEQAMLYAYLGMKEEHSDYAMCGASVIATQTVDGSGGSGGYITVCTLNKGSAQGIKRGMPVLTPMGLFGMVTEVGINHCFVTTVLDASMSVSVICPRSGETGLVTGEFSCLYEGQMLLSQLDETSEIEVGDTVITCGRGSIYPYGIPVGRVTDVYIDPLSRSTCAKIQPFSDVSDTRDVVILTSYVKYTDGDYLPEHESNGSSGGQSP